MVVYCSSMLEFVYAATFNVTTGSRKWNGEGRPEAGALGAGAVGMGGSA